jgi:hypothetical protein
MGLKLVGLDHLLPMSSSNTNNIINVVIGNGPQVMVQDFVLGLQHSQTVAMTWKG